jgi:large subunit ribosomal protein L13
VRAHRQVQPTIDVKALMKTYSPKPREVTQEWFVVDATNKTLGRLATVIANTITGKLKPQYAPHVDVGDYVIVLNAAKIRVTGNKLEQKKYYRHSGFPGGLKERTLAEQLDRHPEEVIRKAVKGMVPRNRLGAVQLKKLKIYQGTDHPHDNYNPQPLPGVEN